jgi:hypothetical protein
MGLNHPPPPPPNTGTQLKMFVEFLDFYYNPFFFILEKTNTESGNVWLVPRKGFFFL